MNSICEVVQTEERRNHQVGDDKQINKNKSRLYEINQLLANRACKPNYVTAHD